MTTSGDGGPVSVAEREATDDLKARLAVGLLRIAGANLEADAIEALLSALSQSTGRIAGLEATVGRASDLADRWAERASVMQSRSQTAEARVAELEKALKDLEFFTSGIAFDKNCGVLRDACSALTGGE